MGSIDHAHLMMDAANVPERLKLGELSIGENIGRGGFGVVHKARLAHLEMDFAIKFLDPSPFNSDKAAASARFLREAEVLLRLRHPYIVPIYGVGEHDGRPYILMEFFPGFDLHRARDEHGTPEPRAVLAFIEFIAAGLAHAHEQGVIHRDIKPSNLMTLRWGGGARGYSTSASQVFWTLRVNDSRERGGRSSVTPSARPNSSKILDCLTLDATSSVSALVGSGC